jgi:cobalt/nickel transport protein
MKRFVFASAAAFLFFAPLSFAHYHMLLPAQPSVGREKPVEVLLQWGHPFEHQLFETAEPDAVFALTPERKRIDLGRLLKKTSVKGEEKDVRAFRFSFVAEERGDYFLVAQMPPLWMEDEKVFWQDTVKVPLHVLTQKGWDNALGTGFELAALTRPYGLEPGMAFQAQALIDGKPAAGVLVEVERYNETPPKSLPPDEHVTRRVKADPHGVFTASLTEAGWWCLTAERHAGEREHEGKRYPLHQRATLWIYVDPKGGVK